MGRSIGWRKAKELENTEEKKIDLKIVLEQNSFEYEESIRSAKIKNANAKAKKGLEDSKKFFEKSIEEKEERIKNFNNKICLINTFRVLPETIILEVTAFQSFAILRLCTCAQRYLTATHSAYNNYYYWS